MDLFKKQQIYLFGLMQASLTEDQSYSDTSPLWSK